jgi:hypothetical protein
MPTADEARFVTGSIMRHVVVMAGTGAIGLIAVFAVDLLNLFYAHRDVGHRGEVAAEDVHQREAASRAARRRAKPVAVFPSSLCWQ